MSTDKTYLDRQLKSPFSRMGSAWFTVWLAKLPIFAPHTAQLVKRLLLLLTLLLSAYLLVPRVPCWLDQQCTISGVYSGFSDARTRLDQATQTLSIATLLGPRHLEVFKNSSLFASNEFLLKNADQQRVDIYRSDEQLSGKPFEVQATTLTRNWDGGWRVVVHNELGQRGELLLSPFGAPRLIRYTSSKE